MNGAKKLHSPDGPAFAYGEVWRSVAGNAKVEIVGVNRYGVDKWDVDVFYWYKPDGETKVYCQKNAWSFQVRYQHIADKEI